MSGVAQEFTDLLLKQRVISLDQLTEVEEVAKTTNADVSDVLIQMEYATPEEVAQAMAKHHKIPYVDLQSVKISDSVIELVPESVARENNVLPYSEEGGSLRV
jgi:type IV pilus assembly protein PilB